MTEIRIGAGGWAYFRALPDDPLSQYARAFQFVEVNSTFYETPKPQVAKAWRGRVGSDFEFSVRAHHSLLRAYSSDFLQLLNQHVKICKALQAVFLVLTPSHSRDWQETVSTVSKVLRAEGIAPVLDCRTFTPSSTMRRQMETLECVEAVDLSVRTPQVRSKTLYSRLFGVPTGNMHQFTDEELKGIHKKSTSSSFDKSILAFHGIKMYSDAARMKVYHQSGALPSATSSLGLESLVEVLDEDMRFPSSKKDLVRFQGWKLIDLSPDKRVPAAQLLAKLPDRVFENAWEVVEALKTRV